MPETPSPDRRVAASRLRGLRKTQEGLRKRLGRPRDFNRLYTPRKRLKVTTQLLSNLPLVSREWENGSNSSYNSTPFLHSLLTKDKTQGLQLLQTRGVGVWAHRDAARGICMTSTSFGFKGVLYLGLNSNFLAALTWWIVETCEQVNA